jgi:plastocyanin
MTTARALVALLLISAFAGCGDDDDDDDDRADAGEAGSGGSEAGSGGSEAGSGGSEEDAGGEPGERRIEVVAREFEFDPDEITASAGETLVIVLMNEGTVDHNIEVEIGDEEFTLDDNVEPDDSAELTFEVPDEPGDHVFYCPIDDHRALGMEGTFTIE